VKVCIVETTVHKPSSLFLKRVEPPKFDPKTARVKAFIHYIENRKREIAVLFFFYAFANDSILAKIVCFQNNST